MECLVSFYLGDSSATFCFSLFYYYYLFFLFDRDRKGIEPWKFVEDLSLEIKLILLTKLVQSLSNLFFVCLFLYHALRCSSTMQIIASPSSFSYTLFVSIIIKESISYTLLDHGFQAK